jgi:hypothetical protein
LLSIAIANIIYLCGQEMAQKWYVVYVGRVPGVYEEWPDCHKQVNGFKGNSYKSYMTREVAEKKWRNHLRRNNRMITRTNLVVITATLLLLLWFVVYLLT